MPLNRPPYALWVLTPNGMDLAERLAGHLPGTTLFATPHLLAPGVEGIPCPSLSKGVARRFNAFSGHIFIMSIGIVVRVIAPLIRNKTRDPAVVVVDDRGENAVSLLSGHLGGGNDLAREVARLIGARPVITTATDVNRVPAVDVMAAERNLSIENPEAIKAVNMALLTGRPVRVHDPYGMLPKAVSGFRPWDPGPKDQARGREALLQNGQTPGIYVDDRVRTLPPQVLILRPATLAAGIGCHRETPLKDIQRHVEQVMAAHALAPASLRCAATLDKRRDAGGLRDWAARAGIPLLFYSRQALGSVTAVASPSETVEKHVGVKSVCEAAAILAARGGPLIVPKQAAAGVTVALARIDSSSWASAPAAGTI